MTFNVMMQRCKHMESYRSAAHIDEHSWPVLSCAATPLSLTPLELATKNKNHNTSHDTYQEAMERAQKQVGPIGAEDVLLLDEDGNEIGRNTVDKKRGWRVDADHVNWWVTRNGHTDGGHAYWTSGELVPHAEDGKLQYELYQGNLTSTGRR